jgi:hypothetical protein
VGVIEITSEFRRILDLLEGGSSHVFLTGKAGTGKSTLLNHFRETTKKKVAVLAPTGVAAVNIRGQTVHSFFGFRPDITVKEAKRLAGRALREEKGGLYRELDLAVIDEVSMLRSDLLDCMDAFLKTVRKERNLPFGGLRMVFIGDLYQLPPVVTARDKAVFEEHYASPYFFDAKIFPKLELELVELETVFRQKDPRFVELLNSVRNNTLSDDQIDDLNRRCEPDWEGVEGLTVHLTATNAQALEINHRKLQSLPGGPFSYEGLVDGDFPEKDLPTERVLNLKTGAQVMLLSNDSFGRWVNGTMATVTALNDGRKNDEAEVTVELEDGREYDLAPVRWDLFRYALDPKRKALTTETVGSFTQYPVKLAWAVTIHKSQGRTFDRVVIDAGRGMFAPGQMYVALSRCRTLEGLVLTRPVTRSHVFVDRRIVTFMTRHRYRTAEEAFPLEQKRKIIERAIGDGHDLEIVYLKPTDEKSRRVIRPVSLGEMEFQGKAFIGLRAYCDKRREERTFRVDRILEMRVV